MKLLIMKLLICTQIMDETDSSLGFFQKWVSALSPKFQEVNVITLKEGVYSMPDNVNVHSLGKKSTNGKRMMNRIKYSARFYRLVWSLRSEYDAIFVHMNQEYILLGGILWKLLGKKIYMWRNHYSGSMLTDVASLFCDKVFCTSKYSYTAKYKKTVLMPVGVDEDSVRMNELIDRIPKSIVFLSRLDISKRPDVLIDALGILAKKNISFTASFVGGSSRLDSSYPDKLKVQVERLGLTKHVTFVGAVPNTETFRYYRSHEIFVNCSKSGMFDKTIFEAMVCGCMVLVTSKDFEALAGSDFVFPDGDAEVLADKLLGFLTIDSEKHARLAEKLADCIKDHRLPRLVERLAEEIQK